MEYATIEAFRSDPEKVWRFYGPRISMLTEAQPNAAHHALAELEQLGYVRAVVTQNIDLLHERGGSREVVEVHGSIRTVDLPAVRRVAQPRARARDARRAARGRTPLCLLRGRAQAGRRLLRRALARARDRALPRLPARPACCSWSAHRSRSSPSRALPHETMAAGGAGRDREPRAYAVRRDRCGEDRGKRGRRPTGRGADIQAAVRLTGRSDKHLAAGEAERPLDFVRNAVALKEHYRGHRRMLVSRFLDDLHVNSD